MIAIVKEVERAELGVALRDWQDAQEMVEAVVRPNVGTEVFIQRIAIEKKTQINVLTAAHFRRDETAGLKGGQIPNAIWLAVQIVNG
ncbi:MAG: hypothetical protein KA764_00215 [Anaerolineales bacterium]|nr:hypothetical protein [Anaerolineales bacterium]